MRFACIGDVHGRIDRLHRVVDWLDRLDVSAALLVGDFTFGWHAVESGEAATAATVDSMTIVRQLGVPSLYVPGNHDRRDLSVPGNIDGRMECVGALRVAGIGGAGPARFGFPYEWAEDEIRDRDLPECDVLLSHTPPARTTLDRVHRGRHVGSEAIRDIAAGMTGVLICGHIHEASGTEVIGRCVCYNTGALGEPYGRCQVGLLEIETDGFRVTVTHHDLDSGREWSRSFPGVAAG